MTLPPVANMALVTLAISVIPVLFVLVNGAQTPLVFLACLNAGYLGVNRVALRTHALYPVATRPLVKDMVRALPMSGAFLAVVLGAHGYLIFGLAARASNAGIAQALYNTWPLFAMALMALSFRGAGRYRRIGMTMWMLSLAVGAGAALVVASKYQGPLWEQILADKATLLATLAIGLGAGAISALSALQFRMAKTMAETVISAEPALKDQQNGLEILLSLIIQQRALAPTIVIASVLAIAGGETVTWSVIPVTIGAAFLINTLIVLPWRKAITQTRQLALMNLIYIGPILSTFWLMGLDDTFLAHPQQQVLFGVGLALIVAGNLICACYRATAERPRSA